MQISPMDSHSPRCACRHACPTIPVCQLQCLFSPRPSLFVFLQLVINLCDGLQLLTDMSLCAQIQVSEIGKGPSYC